MVCALGLQQAGRVRGGRRREASSGRSQQHVGARGLPGVLHSLEPPHHNTNPIFTHEAERFNGWAAMLGFVAAVGAYVTTGQIIPGVF